MKKILSMVTAGALALSLAACGGSASSQTTAAATEAVTSAAAASAAEKEEKKDETTTAAETGSSETDLSAVEDIWKLIDSKDQDYKIGIMSSPVSQGEERYRVAQRLQVKYGEDKVIVDTFPEQAVSEQETTISKVMAMASDPDLKAIVFNQAQDGTIAAIKKLKEVRDDVLTIACNPNEDYDEIATVADLVECKDQIGFGTQVAELAAQMGAKNFLHYSFPRHMSNQNIAKRAEAIKEICEKNNINYVDVTAPDPQGDAGTAGTQQFILEDVPREVAQYGEDTVFFATNTAMHEPMIKEVFAEHAMYCSQSDPTPFDNFPGALGIEIPEDKIGDSEYMLGKIQEKVDAAKMNGRVATWPTSLNSMYLESGYMFARLYLDGYVSTTKGDEALTAIQACVKTLAGDTAEANYWTNNDGKEYDYVYKLLGGQHIFE